MVNPSFQDEYPFSSHFLNFDIGGDREGAASSLQYHYIDEGQGDPVLMIHGNPTWSFYYRHLIKEVSKSHRAIAPDHIGMGLSSKPSADDYSYRLIDRVDNLTQFVNHLDLRNITLVLHDWGGMIGLTWARKHLDRVKALVILNTSGFHLPTSKKLPKTLRVCRGSAVGAALVLGCNGFTRAANLLCSKNGLSRTVKKAYLMPHRTWQDRHSILQFIKDIPLHSADPSFHIVTETQSSLRAMNHIPTLVLWGGRDFVFDDAFYREWQEYMPHASFHYFPEAGHYVLEDAFAECRDHILAFLQQNRELPTLH